MSTDPTKADTVAQAKKRLDDAREAYLAADKIASSAVAAADAAGEPRFYGVKNRELHIAEREAIDVLLDANEEYKVALTLWKSLNDWK